MLRRYISYSFNVLSQEPLALDPGLSYEECPTHIPKKSEKELRNKNSFGKNLMAHSFCRGGNMEGKRQNEKQIFGIIW